MNDNTKRRMKLLRDDTRQKVKGGGKFIKAQAELLMEHRSRVSDGGTRHSGVRNCTRFAYKGI